MCNRDEWPFPEVAEWANLDDCLHDARITSAKFEAADRTLELQIELGFPAPVEPFPTQIRMRFLEVRTFLCFVQQHDSDNRPQHSQDMTALEWDSLVEEYRERALNLTLGSAAFAEQCFIDVVEVDRAKWSGYGRMISMELQGYTSQYPWYRVVISAKSLKILAGDRSVTMDEVVAVGTRAWESWGSREAKGNDSTE